MDPESKIEMMNLVMMCPNIPRRTIGKLLETAPTDSVGQISIRKLLDHTKKVLKMELVSNRRRLKALKDTNWSLSHFLRKI